MIDTTTYQFFSGLGFAFGSGFLVLTVAWIYFILCLRDQSDDCLRQTHSTSFSRKTTPDEARDAHRKLIEMKASLHVYAERAALTAGAIPVLALLGTVIGFFFAIAETGNVGLGSSDPLKILKAMLDAGIGTALATTVAGQALYFCLSLAYGIFVIDKFERAQLHLDEALLCTVGSKVPRIPSKTPRIFRFFIVPKQIPNRWMRLLHDAWEVKNDSQWQTFYARRLRREFGPGVSLAHAVFPDDDDQCETPRSGRGSKCR